MDADASPVNLDRPPKKLARGKFGALSDRFAPGLRCESLLMMSFVWVLLGIGVLNSIPEPKGGLLFELLPDTMRATIWIGTGVFGMVAGLRSRHTSIALGLLTGMPMLRLVSYAMAWVDMRPGVDLPGIALAGGYYYASFYVAQLAFIVFAARIPPRRSRQ